MYNLMIAALAALIVVAFLSLTAFVSVVVAGSVHPLAGLALCFFLLLTAGLWAVRA